MLECQSLRLERFPGTAEPTHWRILESDRQCEMGVARHLPRLHWRQWLSAPTIEVLESEDEALLFTLDRYWGLHPTWLIRDADQRLVGRLRGESAWEADGRFLGQWRQDEHRRWFMAAGRELAELQFPDSRTVTLTFRDDNPFTRMILLADVLRR
jgi:hypothetical protein